MSSIPYETDSGAVHDEYAAGDLAYYAQFDQGHEVWALLAPGAVATEGDPAESAGDGSLQPHTGTDVDEGGAATYTIEDNLVVGEFAEDVDNSGGAEPVRVRVEVN